MTTWIALLRGINVGGNHKLPMKDLKAILENAGCRQVRTYIQSGNAVFQADFDNPAAFAGTVGDAIEKGFGFKPAIHLLTAKELCAAIEANPFPEAVNEPKFLHVNFLASKPQEERVAKACDVLADSERFEIIGKHLYFHAPDGIARSKFAASVDRLLGVSATGRNWNTVTRLAEMST